MKKFLCLLPLLIFACTKPSVIDKTIPDPEVCRFPTTISATRSVSGLFVSTEQARRIPDRKQPGVLFIDMDGYYHPGGPYYSTTPIDCLPSGLTVEQQKAVYQQVVNYYQGFNITITTDSTVYLAALVDKRQRAVVTQSWEWYGQVGGVSYIGSFRWGSGTPCFIFSSLLNFDVRKISQVVSHEGGHTLSLKHQSSYDSACVQTAQYNAGDSATAPLMGIPYYTAWARWWVGPTQDGCTDIQEDSVKMVGYLKQ